MNPQDKYKSNSDGQRLSLLVHFQKITSRWIIGSLHLRKSHPCEKNSLAELGFGPKALPNKHYITMPAIEMTPSMMQNRNAQTTQQISKAHAYLYTFPWRLPEQLLHQLVSRQKMVSAARYMNQTLFTHLTSHSFYRIQAVYAPCCLFQSLMSKQVINTQHMLVFLKNKNINQCTTSC